MFNPHKYQQTFILILRIGEMFLEVNSFAKGLKSIKWHSHNLKLLLPDCEAHSHTLTPGPPQISGFSSVGCLEIDSILLIIIYTSNTTNSSSNNTFILRIKNLKLKEVKRLIQSYSASKWSNECTCNPNQTYGHDFRVLCKNEG